jgi:hypothetical protein
VVTRSEWFQQHYYPDMPEEAKNLLFAAYHAFEDEVFEGYTSDPGSEED